MAPGTRRRVALAAWLMVLAACAPKPAAHGMPHGIVFVLDSSHSTSPLVRDPERSRVFRDGKLVARIEGRVFAARDAARNSLIYDDWTKRARRFGGGPSWKFDPCPDVNGVRTLALSPNGRRGVCAFSFSNTDRLVLFDVSSPSRAQNVIFRNLSDNRLYRAAWLDDNRIALVEYRGTGCRYYAHYGDAPAGLVIIDVKGRVLERGPCMAGVAAGPHGLVYVDYFGNWKHGLVPFSEEPRDRMVFSVDRGRSWHDGQVQFADGEAHAFSLAATEGHGMHDPSCCNNLRDESGAALVTGVQQATWAKP